MKIGVYDHQDYPGFGERMEEFEACGYDTLITHEGTVDSFVRAAVAADRTKQVEIQSGITLAFGHSSMNLALSSHDINVLSEGRFRLGLGSQVKAHISRRYSMPYSRPAARMRELVAALHAIWDCWYEGKPLDFRGEFYTHTLMTPYFIPPNKQFGRPPVDIGAVGPLMTKVAAECGDGIICHQFSTPKYMREVTLPIIEASLKQRNMRRKQYQITGIPFVATGETEEALEVSKEDARKMISFYASTPTYKAVLDLHGWGALHAELHTLTCQGRWKEMSSLINDEVLSTFAVVGTGKEVIPQLRERYSGIYDRIAVRFDAKGELLRQMLSDLKA